MIDPQSLPTTIAGDNTPYENDYTACGGVLGDDEPDVVYSLTPEVSGIYSFGMPGYSNGVGASLLGITTDCSVLLPGGAGQCLTSKDYYGTGGAPMDIPLEAGTTYFFVIDSYASGEIGAFNLSISAPCTPVCEAGACGGDGCGGTCGCGDGQVCFEELCCEPSCDGTSCGESSNDGCGGTCGCDGGTTCFEGTCCEPVCDGVTCGAGSEDSCGGSCGCNPGSLCVEGTCQTAPEGDQCSLPFEVVFDASGVFAFDGDTSDATSDYGYAGGDCPGETSSWGSASKDEVFLLSAKVEGDYVVTLNATYDSNLFAVTDCLDIANSCLAANEEMTVETITLTMKAGEQAFVIVDGWSNSSDKSGAYNLTITAP